MTEPTFDVALAKWAHAHSITEIALDHLRGILQHYGKINETEAA